MVKRKISISASTRNKSMNAVWDEDSTRISINFYQKTKDRTQVVIQHQKLKDSGSAVDKKIFWKEKLVKLQEYL